MRNSEKGVYKPEPLESLVLVGASNIIYIVFDILSQTKDNIYKKLYIIDDNKRLWGTEIDGCKVIGGHSQIERLSKEYKFSHLLITISENHMRVRDDYYKKCLDLGFTFPNIIHHSSVISKSVVLGQGIIICAGAVINPQSKLEDNVVVFTGSTVDHHNKVGRSSIIGPGVHTAGLVTIKKRVFIGVGAIVLPRVTLGDDAIIGAGSIVTRDLPRKSMVRGVASLIGKG